MPVPAVAGETGGIEANHNTDLTDAEPGDELLEAGPRHGFTRGASEIVVDHLDIAEPPPSGFIDEVGGPVATEPKVRFSAAGGTTSAPGL